MNTLRSGSDYKYIMTIVYAVVTVCFLGSIIPVINEVIGVLALIVIGTGLTYFIVRGVKGYRYMRYLMNASQNELIEDERRNPGCRL